MSCVRRSRAKLDVDIRLSRWSAGVLVCFCWIVSYQVRQSCAAGMGHPKGCGDAALGKFAAAVCSRLLTGAAKEARGG